MERLRKTKVGRVVARKMDKTAVVEVVRLMRHPEFKKYVRKTKVFKIHDAKNECQVGDQVETVEARPISKTKRWKMQKIVRRAEGVLT